MRSAKEGAVRRIVVMLFGIAGALAAASPAWAGDLRDIATVGVNSYFNGTFEIDTEDVFLAKLSDLFTGELKVDREDLPGWYQHVFSIGPVISFTPKLYLVALYGLGVDSNGLYSHTFTAEIDRETNTELLSASIKAQYYPASRYFYVLPSIGGTFHPLPRLGILNKLFLSWDTTGAITESLWSQVDYFITKAVDLRAGVTLDYDYTFGFSAILGASFTVTPNVLAKYALQYLAEPLAPTGIRNELSVDVSF